MPEVVRLARSALCFARLPVRLLQNHAQPAGAVGLGACFGSKPGIARRHARPACRPEPLLPPEIIRRIHGPPAALQQSRGLCLQFLGYAGCRKKTLLLGKGRTTHKKRPRLQAALGISRLCASPHMPGHGQRQMKDLPRPGPGKLRHKRGVRHENERLAPPGQAQGRKHMPGIVHQPQGHRNPHGPTQMKNTSFRIQPPQVYRQEKAGTALFKKLKILVQIRHGC